MKRLTLKRKAYTLASCIFIMVVVMLLSVFIVTAIRLQNSQKNLQKALLDNRTHLSELGERFVSQEVTESGNDEFFSWIVSVVEGDKSSFEVFLSSGDLALKVVKDSSGNIILWNMNY